MDYKKVNKALAKAFGAGKIELRQAAPDAGYEFSLWFASDDPSPRDIARAKSIVEKSCGFLGLFNWMDNAKVYSKE